MFPHNSYYYCYSTRNRLIVSTKLNSPAAIPLFIFEHSKITHTHTYVYHEFGVMELGMWMNDIATAVSLNY